MEKLNVKKRKKKLKPPINLPKSYFTLVDVCVFVYEAIL